jgi:hypothetical protein
MCTIFLLSLFKKPVSAEPDATPIDDKGPATVPKDITALEELKISEEVITII